LQYIGLKIFQLFQQVFFNTLIIEELEYKRKQKKFSRSHAATAQKYKGNKKSGHRITSAAT